MPSPDLEGIILQVLDKQEFNSATLMAMQAILTLPGVNAVSATWEISTDDDQVYEFRAWRSREMTLGGARDPDTGESRDD